MSALGILTLACRGVAWPAPRAVEHIDVLGVVLVDTAREPERTVGAHLRAAARAAIAGEVEAAIVAMRAVKLALNERGGPTGSLPSPPPSSPSWHRTLTATAADSGATS